MGSRRDSENYRKGLRAERTRILKIIKSLERRNCFGVIKYIDKNKLKDAILGVGEK